MVWSLLRFEFKCYLRTRFEIISVWMIFESSKSFSKTLPVSTKLIQRMDVSIRLSYLKYFFSLLLINSLTERTNSWRNFKIVLIQCIYIIAIELFHDLILHISNNCMVDFITNLLRLFLIFFYRNREGFLILYVHYKAISAPHNAVNLWPSGHKFNTFNRGLHGHNYYALVFCRIYTEIKKFFFK